MQIWKKLVAGCLVSLAMMGGVAGVANAQEAASLSADVSLCKHDLSWCDPVEGFTVYFDVNDLNNETAVLTNATGGASFEVKVGDTVAITVDPNAIPGASISPESQAGYVVSSVVGNEETFFFVFVEDAPSAGAALPAAGSGPVDSDGSTLALLAMVGGAAALAAGGVVLRKRAVI